MAGSGITFYKSITKGRGCQRPNTPHAGGKASKAKARLMITCIVEKGKPLATPT